MSTVLTLLLCLAVILNSIELSLQFDCLPNGAPIPDVTRSAPSSSSARHHFPERSRPPADKAGSLPLHTRSRSPPIRHSSLRILGFDLGEIEFIRLIPKTNPHRRFAIRRYTFPDDKPITLRGADQNISPMPTEEGRVLTTAAGDVVAIMSKNTVLRGIYNHNGNRRAGINMKTGEVFELSPELVRETPLGNSRPIPNNFDVVHVNQV